MVVIHPITPPPQQDATLAKRELCPFVTIEVPAHFLGLRPFSADGSDVNSFHISLSPPHGILDAV